MTAALRRRLIMLLLLILILAISIGSRYYPLINRIEVIGATHYTPQEVATLAGVAYQEPLLWVTTFSLRPLINDPWIASANVQRDLRGTVTIEVNERRAAATNGVQIFAIDGTVLPGARTQETAALVRFEGWGTSRVDEALELTVLLENLTPKVISYSPAGFNIQLENSSVFTPTVNALKTHWASFLSQQGTHASVYPWGVSASYE